MCSEQAKMSMNHRITYERGTFLDYLSNYQLLKILHGVSTNDQYHAPQFIHFREAPCYSYRVRISVKNIPTGDLRAVLGIW